MRDNSPCNGSSRGKSVCGGTPSPLILSQRERGHLSENEKALLWRSLFETDVLCQYIGARLSNDHLACRYLIHSIVRPTILRWEAFNKNCLRLGQPQRYTHEEVERRKQVYKLVFNKDFGNRGGDYEWTLDPKHKPFYRIAEATDCDMLFTALRTMRFTPHLAWLQH